MTTRRALQQLVVAALVLTAPLAANAQQPGANEDPYYWPSDRKERLAEIDVRVTERLRQAVTAGYMGRLEEKVRLMQQVETLQREARGLSEQRVSASAVPQADGPPGP